MRFFIEGNRTRIVTTEITESFSGCVDITKKEVMAITGCPAVEDGDPTAWYGYVEEAILQGAKVKEDLEKDVVMENKTEESIYTILDVSW
jgi:hypothetical protein